jgi:uncharacterized protein (TIGR02466 family)
VVSNPSVALTSRFATPFFEAKLQQCEALNQALETLFLTRNNAEYRNHSPSHIPQEELFESRFNLFRWPEQCVQDLRKVICEQVIQVALSASRLPRADFATLALQNHAWFHITDYGGSFVAHNHPLASWSAVYCVRAGQHPHETEARSGLLRFFDPRSGAGSYQDPANASLLPTYGFSPVEFRLVAGQLLIFPSYLFHEVTPFYGVDKRITVAANFWFV